MMKYLTLIIALICIQGCSMPESSTVIYKENTFDLKNSTDKEKLLAILSENLPENELNNGLQDINIRKGTDDATGEEYTYLFSESQNKLFRMAILLEQEADKKSFKITEELFVMCYGTEDCITGRYNNNWFCNSPYEAGKDNFACKKTVTLVIEE